ncbi:Internalin-A precursor [Symmachiella macrocystis]|uniref:Internalin-A n=1 Tax=Symmachiella macrocystis TaxID=2527985 RepID=A0A5C6B4S3_9PLAN|nr:hypothetical protein [Symmachiella macrocystis]TWU06928.1 Internalin-A precursor [Symmachiella macrocystis]
MSHRVLAALLVLCCVVGLTGCENGPTEQEKTALTVIQQETGALISVQKGGAAKVDFTHMGVDDAGLEPIKHVKHLRMLILAGTSVTDAGMKNLSELPRIRQMTLRGTQIGDKGLESLSGLTTLEELDLSHTQVTDAGMQHLAKMTGLQKVYLGGTAVTYEGRKLLREALPNTKVFQDE